MLSKCANPGCPAPFLYLHQGKLFRVETGVADPTAGEAAKKPARRTEYFWLCSECALKLTLSYKKGVGVVAVPFCDTPRKEAAAAS